MKVNKYIPNMQYGDPNTRTGLPFRADEDEIAWLGEKSHAIQILRDAVEQCYDQDMRTREVIDALEYLKTRKGRCMSIYEFREALNLTHPEQRQFALKHYLAEIEKELS
jgi:hypothetical protein